MKFQYSRRTNLEENGLDFWGARAIIINMGRWVIENSKKRDSILVRKKYRP